MDSAVDVGDGSELWLDYDGTGRELLIAVSPTQFVWDGAHVEFSPPRAARCACSSSSSTGRSAGQSDDQLCVASRPTGRIPSCLCPPLNLVLQ